jgi:hypothetical protein
LASAFKPEAIAKWAVARGSEIAKATAGEVGITTPAQTILEQKVGEAAGVKEEKPWDELMADTGKCHESCCWSNTSIGWWTCGN